MTPGDFNPLTTYMELNLKHEFEAGASLNETQKVCDRTN
jgi:hypothetical protein